MTAGGHWWRWDTRYHATPTSTTIQVIEPASRDAAREHEEREQAKRTGKPLGAKTKRVPFGFARALDEEEPRP